MNYNIYIWGTGANAKKINDLYPDEIKKDNIIGYIDNDKSKTGTVFFGKTVFSPEILNIEKNVAIYISVYEDKDIKEQLYRDYPNDIKLLDKDYFFKKKMMTRYEASEDVEIQEIMRYLENNTLKMFNYFWADKYENSYFEFGRQDGLIYVIHNGRKLFFSKKYDTEIKAKNYYISLLIEQDELSPHRYLTNEYDVVRGDIVVDVGAAEGIFSLDVISIAKKIYIIEPDNDWVEALEHTFADYHDKIKIINKCVSNYHNESTVMLDEVINERQIDFLKMDIEGEEFYALCGAKRIIEESENLKCVVCSYHQEFAYYALKSVLEQLNCETKPSRGYMWFYEHFNNMRPSTLRRALIRAKKRSVNGAKTDY